MKKLFHKLNVSGFVVSGSGLAGEIEGPIEVMLAGVVGAMLGFVLGLFSGALARLFTLGRAKGIIGGHHWAAYGAGAGALALAMIELFD